MTLAHNIQKIQEKLVIRTFCAAARTVPYYKNLLRGLAVDPTRVRDLRDFTGRAPILDKNRLFTENLHEIGRIISGNSFSACEAIFPSSGFSGKFSFGLLRKGSTKAQGKRLYKALNFVFGISSKRTLLINALSMGISMTVPKVVTVNTGLRSDIVISVLRTFGAYFDQFILIGENAFIKKTVEEGEKTGLAWPDINIHVIFGGESFPESYRTYLESFLGPRPDLLVGASFGFAESGLNVMSETRKSVLIRRKAALDPGLISDLVGKTERVSPVFMQYYPFGMYVEAQDGMLLFTDLAGGARLPVIRYSTGDEGAIIPYDKAKAVLLDHGLSKCLPDYGLPLVALKGRAEFLTIGGERIYPDLVKDAIFSDRSLADLTTGYFRMKKKDEALSVELQLKDDAPEPVTLINRFKSAVKARVRTEPEMTLYPYGSFPYAMELDYEKKFRYI
ncbi:MAG: hypothetical protein HQL30_09940 [Candidatus Omnitrophica bacterium]|nr:hypothetical protein [Candidatus Omnitrophota bacterium]